MPDRLSHYILDDERQVVAVDLLTWARWFEIEKRRVAETSTALFWISTVFLGLDHQWGKGPPLLFETMIFERSKVTKMGPVLDELDGEQWRYSTWDDAEAGHHATVKRVLRLEADAEKKAAMMARIRERIKGER